jgi:hypothetical protein
MRRWLGHLPLLCVTLSVSCGDDGSGETDPTGAGTSAATVGDSGGATAGSASVDDSGTGDPTSDPTGPETGDDSGTTGAPVDYDVLPLRINAHSVATAETDYVCFEFPLSVDSLAHVVGFNPVIDNAAYVHHYVVTLLDQPTGQPDGYDCFDLSGDLIWAWAPGQGEYMYPQEAGLLVGDQPGGQFTIRIQVHYNNPLGTSGEVDSSGLDLYVTQDLRPNNAGTAVFADVGGIMIPAGDPAYEHVADCTSQETSAMLNGPITVFGSSMHAHEVGSVLWTDVERDGQFLLELNRDDPYDFNSQTYKPIDSVVIEPGDALRNHCIYDASGSATPISGGPGTGDEMCWNTVLYYPRENANFDYCGNL